MVTRGLALDLLENLGFLINYKKSELSPVQNISFLEFMIDSVGMRISLPSEKVDSTVREAKKFLINQQISTRQLAHMIGIFSSTIPAIFPAPHHYRELQALKHWALRSGGYSSTVTLSEGAKRDLEWWISNLDKMNGHPIHRDQPALIITTDASFFGWGAHCQGCRIGGPWSEEERSHYINYLELLGALLAVKSFCRNREDLSVHLKMDNSSAVAYINHLGGTRSSALYTLVI